MNNTLAFRGAGALDIGSFAKHNIRKRRDMYYGKENE
jgi:hypothetical protein